MNKIERAKNREKNWRSGNQAVEGDKTPSRNDFEHNLAELERIRSIFYPNPGKLNKNVEAIKRAK